MSMRKLSNLCVVILLGNSVSFGGLGFEGQGIAAERAVPNQAAGFSDSQASTGQAYGVATRTPQNPEQPLFADALDAGPFEESTDPAVIRSRLVEVDFGQLTLLGSGESDSVILDLFDDLAVTAVVKRVEYRDATNITLHGIINGEPGGTFTLVVAGPIVVANIRVPGIGFYQLRYSSSGIHIIHEMDESRYPDCGGAIEPNVHQPANVPVTEDRDAASGGETEIDVLILYTGQARLAAGGTAGMIALITLAIAETNGAYENSSIIPRFQLVHTEEVEYTEPTGPGSFSLMLNDLRTGANGLGIAHILRDLHCADMVSLFVDGLEFCGTAYVMSAPFLPPFDFAPRAFSVVNWQCAGGNLTLPHELGHNVGCKHNRENACSSAACSTLCCAGDSALQQALGAYEYSYGHRIPGLWRTIMSASYTGCSCARIPHFSNPDVLYAGNPTGIPGGHPDGTNNALTINNTASIAASWRASECTPSVVYVDTDASGPLHNGLSWCNAMTDLQDALDLAVAGSEIHVAGGVYRPDQGTGDRTANFYLFDGISIKGGYAGCGAPDPDERDVELHETFLSGDLNDDDDPTDFPNGASFSDNAYHVIRYRCLTPATVLDGFTISGGNANGAYPADHGGGISSNCSAGAPTIRNCIFQHNFAASSGGAMWSFAGGAPMVTDCLFDGNATGESGSGGAIFKGGSSTMTLMGCTFTENSAYSGGVIYVGSGSITIHDCIFLSNEATGSGGGIYNSGAIMVLNSSLFENNSAGSWGGGVYNSNADSTIRGCTFDNNTSGSGGGGVYIFDNSPTIEDCVFIGNSAGSWGGGVYNSNADSTIRGCIFDSNTSNSLAGAINIGYSSPGPVIDNCTFMANEAYSGGAIVSTQASPEVTNCLFVANLAVQNGGAVTIDKGNPSFTNSTFVLNSAGGFGGGLRSFSIDPPVPALNNSIFWNNSDSGPMDESAQISWSGVFPPVVNFSCVQGWTGNLGGVGNIGDDPLFADADYHLSGGSPSINTGDPDFVPELDETDLDGDPRVMGCRIDMGSDEFYPDCNENGVMDDDDLSSGNSVDCNENCTPDECDLPDCNQNSIPDECEADTDGDGVVDDCDNCELFNPDQADCQPNGIGDVCDLNSGTSEDCNANDTPDECDIASGESSDCQPNGVPDECELDTDNDGVIDVCDNCELFNPDQADCQPNGVGDTCDIADGTSGDCNMNGTPDECDITDGVSEDCQGNGVPDECDLGEGTSEDCNSNAIPDECEEGLGPIITGQPMSQEVAPGGLVFFTVIAEGVLLEYQWRKDGLDLIDSERIFGSQASTLLIFDVVPADAGDYDCAVTDLFTGCSTVSDVAVLMVAEFCPADLSGDGVVEAFDLAILLGAWGPCPEPCEPGDPADTCDAELSGDCVVEAFDLALLLGDWGSCE